MLRRLLGLLGTRGGRLAAVAVALSVASFGISLSLIDVPRAEAALPESTFQPVPGAVAPEIADLARADEVTVRMGLRQPERTVERRFAQQGVRRATGLVQAEDEEGHIVGLVLVPKPDGVEVGRATVDVHSTAVALVALNPGLLTATPELDLLLAHEIGRLPEIAQLEAALRADLAASGARYLEAPSPQTVEAVGVVVGALPAALRARAGSTAAAAGVPVPPEAEEPEEPLRSARSCDGPAIAPVDGLEGDDVCVGVRAHTAAEGGEPERVDLRTVNRSPRWALVADEENAVPRAMQPKEWVVPSLAALGEAVSLALANSRDANAAKDLLDDFGTVFGVDYKPYYGADSFLTQLRLQLERFGKDRVTDMERMPVPGDRALQVVSFAWPPGPVGGAHPVLSAAAALGTLTTVVILPLVSVVLDIRSAKGDIDDARGGAGAAPAGARLDTDDSDEPADLSPDPSARPDLPTDAQEDEGCEGQAEALVGLATELMGPLTAFTGAMSAAGDNSARAKAFVEVLPAVAVQVLQNLELLACLLDAAAWELALQGALGQTVQKIAGTLDEKGIRGFGAAAAALTTGTLPSGAQVGEATRTLVKDLLSNVVQGLVTKLVTKLALVLAPGGQLVYAVKAAEQAPELSGWGLSVVDLFQTVSERADGSDYRLAGARTIDKTLDIYPTELSEDASVDYAPEWYGVVEALSADVAGERIPGFWVSGEGALDAFGPQGEKQFGYVVDVIETGRRLRRQDGDGRTVFTTKLPGGGAGSTRMLLTAGNNNLYVYQGGLGGQGKWLVDGDDGRMLRDIGAAEEEAGLSNGGFDLFGGGGWWLPDGAVVSVRGERSLLVDTSSGATTVVDRGLDLSGTSYSTPDGRSWLLAGDAELVALQGGGLRSVTTLPHAPVQNNHGVEAVVCGGRYAFATEDGLLASMTASSSLWTRHVDPAQQEREGNRATHSTIDPAGCALIGADDHGVLSRYDSSGRPVWTRRFAHYSQAEEDSQASHAVSGLSRAGRVVTAVSDADPHIVAFDAKTGDNVWAYALPSANAFLARLTDDVLLAIGVDGALTVVDVTR